jgi:guanylate kinase
VEKRLANAKVETETVKQLAFYEHLLNDDLEQSKARLIEFLNNKYGLTLAP